MSEPDPNIVRKVARSAMTLAAQRRDDIDHAILRHGNLGDRPEGGEELREYRTAYGALFSAVRAEMHTATIAVSWSDEKPQNVREDSSAAKRVLAYLDDHRARYPYDATGVIADLPAAYDNGLLPLHELLESDLRDLLAQNRRLRLQNDPALISEVRQLREHLRALAGMPDGQEVVSVEDLRVSGDGSHVVSGPAFIAVHEEDLAARIERMLNGVEPTKESTR